MLQATSAFLSLASAFDPDSHSATTSHAPPVVYVVCGDVALRQSLKSLIDSAGWRLEAFASPREFLARGQTLLPSCLVIDGSPPDRDDLHLLERITAERSDIPAIFILGDGDVSMTVKVMKAGASEVLTKRYRHEVLLDAIGLALERSRSALEDEDAAQVLHERYVSLSRREREIMALVVLGRLNKQIAGELGISEITVKAHRGRMMRKMMARSVPQLVLMYVRLGGHSPRRSQAQPTTRADGARPEYPGNRQI
jgi:FixJ family two-component response regulator